MPAYDASRKENAAAAAPLHRGGRVPQRRAATAAPGPTLDIPIDDDLLAAEPAHRAAPSQVKIRPSETGLAAASLRQVGSLLFHLSPERLEPCCTKSSFTVEMMI